MYTILEIKQQLLCYLDDNKYFDLSKDKKHIDIGERKAAKLQEAILDNVLSTLVDDGIVQRVDTAEDRIYMLSFPLEFLTQSVELNYSTCVHIASIINEYCSNTGNENDLCDPQNISNKDVANVLSIISLVLQQSASSKEEE